MRKSSEFEIQPYRVNYKNTTPNDRIQASLYRKKNDLHEFNFSCEFM